MLNCNVVCVCVCDCVDVNDKFLSEDFECLEVVLDAQSLFTAEHVQQEMKLKAGVCGKIANALKEVTSRPPPPSPSSSFPLVACLLDC